MTPSTHLDPDLRNVLDELHRYETEKVSAVQKRRERRSVAKHMDGEWCATRALNALGEDRLSALAPYEKSVSDRIAERLGAPPRPGFIYVPLQRDLTVASVGSGGYLVGTDTAPAGLFAEALEETLPLGRMGVKRYSLIRSASIPGCTGAITPYWLSDEGQQITEDAITIAAAASTPKHIGAAITASRQWLLQTSDYAQRFVWRIITNAIASEVFKKFINGSGVSGQPDGILGYSGINSIAGASMNLSTVLNAVEDVEEGSAIVNPGSVFFAMAPNVARMARARERASGSGLLMVRDDLAGYPAVVSKCIPDSTAVCGDWSQAVLFDYSALQIGIDPFGMDGANFRRGAATLRAIWSIDMMLLHPTSFVEMTTLS